MVSKSSDVPHGFTIGQTEDAEDESSGNAGDIDKQTENKAFSPDKQAFLRGDKDT